MPSSLISLKHINRGACSLHKFKSFEIVVIILKQSQEQNCESTLRANSLGYNQTLERRLEGIVIPKARRVLHNP
jgi:hypothetical protein